MSRASLACETGLTFILTCHSFLDDFILVYLWTYRFNLDQIADSIKLDLIVLIWNRVFFLFFVVVVVVVFGFFLFLFFFLFFFFFFGGGGGGGGKK